MASCRKQKAVLRHAETAFRFQATANGGLNFTRFETRETIQLSANSSRFHLKVIDPSNKWANTI